MLEVGTGRQETAWNLLIIDPQEFTRANIGAVLGAGGGVAVTAVADIDGIDPRTPVDVVLLRVDGGYGGDGRVGALLRRIRRKLPGVPVSLLAGQGDLETSIAAVRDGARGYLSSALGAVETVAALRLVAAGGVFIGPAHAIPGRVAGETDGSLLTARERQVLAHLRQGKPNKVIAYELGMSENTVKAHVGSILRKLNVINRTAIASMQPDL